MPKTGSSKKKARQNPIDMYFAAATSRASTSIQTTQEEPMENSQPMSFFYEKLKSRIADQQKDEQEKEPQSPFPDVHVGQAMLDSIVAEDIERSNLQEKLEKVLYIYIAYSYCIYHRN